VSKEAISDKIAEGNRMTCSASGRMKVTIVVATHVSSAEKEMARR
jgi:hypothetical protein